MEQVLNVWTATIEAFFEYMALTSTRLQPVAPAALILKLRVRFRVLNVLDNPERDRSFYGLRSSGPVGSNPCRGAVGLFRYKRPGCHLVVFYLTRIAQRLAVFKVH